jgi:hypothetical protein
VCVAAAATPVVVAVVAHTIFRALYYDALLPNTYYLKVSGVPLSVRLHRGAVALVEVTALHIGVLAVLAVAYFALARRRAPAGSGLLAACVVGAAAYVLAVGADAWEWTLSSDRYLAPVVPFLVILAVMGGEAVVHHVRSRRPRDGVAVGVLLALGGLLIVVAVNALPDTRIIQVQSPSAGTALSRALWLAPIVAVVGLVALAPRARPWWGAALVVGLVVAVSGPSLSAWWHRNAAAQPDDLAWARYGMALRRATGPNVTIAMSSAGNIAYFDRRPGVDLLGKSDRVIAREAPVYVDGYFLPGHSKRDFAYSVGRLRPEVVAQIFGPTPADVASLRSWGYVLAGTTIWYLPGTPGIDVPALRRAATLYH